MQTIKTPVVMVDAVPFLSPSIFIFRKMPKLPLISTLATFTHFLGWSFISVLLFWFWPPRPVSYTGCWLHVSPRCGAVRNFR